MFSFFKKPAVPAPVSQPEFNQLEKALIKSALLEPDNWVMSGLSEVARTRVFTARHPERGIDLSWHAGDSHAEICCDHVRGTISAACACRAFTHISETHASRAHRAALVALDKAPTMVEGGIVK